jgi:hypothetical protein
MSSTDNKTFSLVGGSPSQLQQYVDSKVEIRGTLDSNANRSGAGSTAGGTGSTAGGTGSTAGGTGSTAGGTGSTMTGMSHSANQQLRVTSVRQLASSCSGQ